MRVETIFLIALFGLAALFVYFIPTFIAVRHRHPKRVAIFAVNLLLGVTILGYIAAILWATAPMSAPEK